MEHQGLRFLLVDDDLVDRRIVKRALVAAGLEAEVVEVDAAEPALELLLREPDAFHCGIFDLRLPDRDGLDLLKSLRAGGCETPIVFLTGQGSEDVAVDLMKSGASDYLPKSQLTPTRLRRSILQAVRLAAIERRQQAAELALRESEASFRRLAENLPDAVVRFDREGRHRYVNHPVPWGVGLDVHAIIGHTIAEAGLDASTIAPLEAALARALDGEPTQVTVYLPLRPRADAPREYGDDARERERDDGEPTPRWMEVRFVPERELDARDATAAPRTVLALCRDVTAETLRAQEDAQRSEFERQLVGIVSHDLRNPIGALLLATQALQRQLGVSDDGEDPVARAISVVRTSGRRAERMVSDLLDFTRARLGGAIPMRLVDCDLLEVIEQVLTETRTAHPGRRIELTVDARADLRGRFDPDRVAQALSNLLVNAVMYSPPEDPITVELSGGEEQSVAIAVANRGKTIPSKTIPLLFRPFQRGPSSQHGRSADRSIGLGLFIVEQIVRGHRGEIDVTSAEGLTVFRMVLPRQPALARPQRITRPIPPIIRPRSADT